MERRRYKPLKAARRRLVVDRMLPLQNGLCWWHGEVIKDDEKSIEHLVPLACGGTNNPTNLVIACQRCNHARGVDEYWCMHTNLIGTVRQQLMVGHWRENKLLTLLDLPWRPPLDLSLLHREPDRLAPSNGERKLTSLAPQIA